MCIRYSSGGLLVSTLACVEIFCGHFRTCWGFCPRTLLLVLFWEHSFRWRSIKTLIFILCFHLVTFLHWLVWPLVFPLSNLPVCWPLPWPLPPFASAFPSLSLRCSCCGSRGNVTLWGTCGWWVAPGLRPAASLGAWHVSPAQGGFWVVHDEQSHSPCIVPFLYLHLYQRAGSGVMWGDRKWKLVVQSSLQIFKVVSVTIRFP